MKIMDNYMPVLFPTETAGELFDKWVTEDGQNQMLGYALGKGEASMLAAVFNKTIAERANCASVGDLATVNNNTVLVSGQPKHNDLIYGIFAVCNELNTPPKPETRFSNMVTNDFYEELELYYEKHRTAKNSSMMSLALERLEQEFSPQQSPSV